MGDFAVGAAASDGEALRNKAPVRAQPVSDAQEIDALLELDAAEAPGD